jgi:peptide/nickel transport system substrate-binding protein
VRQVNGYLTRTGIDNVTRADLLEGWQASDDLKTWTLNLRQGVTWSNGEPFVAEHVAWNLSRVLDANVGSSVVGLMKGYMLKEDADGNTSIWDANAIEVVDDHTVRLNAQAAQLAVPEHLFHYPLLILYPEENGEWDAGSVGTGAFTCESVEVGKSAILKAREGYYGEGPYVDEVHFIDHGDDEAAQIAALASRQVHGMYEASVTQYEVLKGIEHLELKEVSGAQTGVFRMRMDQEIWQDQRVRKAMRLALDTEKLLQIAHLNIGSPGEHHHVAPTHPEYADIGFMKQDVEAAKALLAEAGHPEGFEIEVVCKKDPAWELITVQTAAEMYKDIGVNLQINVLPSSQFWEVWDKVPFGFTSWTHRPLGIMVLGLAYRSGVPWNESAFSNARFDELLTKAEGTLDVEARREIMVEIETLMQEEGPIAQPLWRGLFSFWDKQVQGFEQHPTSYIFGEELWLEPA